MRSGSRSYQASSRNGRFCGALRHADSRVATRGFERFKIDQDLQKNAVQRAKQANNAKRWRIRAIVLRMGVRRGQYGERSFGGASESAFDPGVAIPVFRSARAMRRIPISAGI